MLISCHKALHPSHILLCIDLHRDFGTDAKLGFNVHVIRIFFHIRKSHAGTEAKLSDITFAVE